MLAGVSDTEAAEPDTSGFWCQTPQRASVRLQGACAVVSDTIPEAG